MVWTCPSYYSVVTQLVLKCYAYDFLFRRHIFGYSVRHLSCWLEWCSVPRPVQRVIIPPVPFYWNGCLARESMALENVLKTLMASSCWQHHGKLGLHGWLCWQILNSFAVQWRQGVITVIQSRFTSKHGRREIIPEFFPCFQDFPGEVGVHFFYEL